MKKNEADLIDKYVVLFEKAQSYGFSPESFIYEGEKTKKTKDKKFLYSTVFILLFSCFIFYNEILIEISSMFQEEEKECLLPNAPLISDLFLSPSNCDFCKNSTNKIKKVKMMDRNVFEELYAYSGTPVVVTDATKNWKAMSEFNMSFFFNLYKNDTLGNDCQFFPYSSKLKNLSQALDPENFPKTAEAKKSWYFGWGNCNEKATEVLRKYYSQPYFLPEESGAAGIDWIFMGFKGKGAPIHLDRVGESSWQAQIKGRKLWKLQPPPECYFQCYQSYMEVVLEEGEMIVVDTNLWYHSTEIFGEEMSLSIGSEYD